MEPRPYYVIDFDSTFNKLEALEELAAIALKKNPDREKVVEKIRDITKQGLEGKIPFEESLRRRVSLLRANRSHLETLIKLLKKNITPSFARNKKFFKEYAGRVYIISGGFKDFIIPVVKSFGIPESHVLANAFTFDKSGAITGYDVGNPLAGKGGKTEAVKRLQLRGDIYVIGDGFTDYELKKNGVAKKFFVFIENIERAPVIKFADHIVHTLDEFLYINSLPMSVSFPKSRMKVLLPENVHPDAVALFKREGYTVETLARALPEEELVRAVKDVSILGIRSKTEITKKVLASAPKLLAIGAFCIGTNQINLEECSRRGVVVFNAPYSSTRSVVELAIGEMIMLLRGVFDKSMKLHQGIWDKSAKSCFEVHGKTLGIIGYGNIGAQLSVVAESFGAQVVFYDIVPKLAMGNASSCASMEELLEKSDVVTLHVDGNPKNHNLIGARELKQMKSGSILINLARGHIVDIPALAEALKSGKLAGAALDVYPREPRSNDEKFVCELQQMSNVILTPHIGGSTEEAQKNIGQFVSSAIADFVNVGNTYLSVNFPNIQLPKLKEAHRFIHIHDNVPGILAAINGTLAKNKINILGQYLKTNDMIGYVITDVAKKYDAKVIEHLKKVDHTIKFRVLY